ncbi:MAG: metalloregulator ArsR/SmtB family transcription factor [Desulfobacterales bacterium]
MGETMRHFIKVMKALSDPRRIMILKLLQHRSYYAGELQAALGISQSATSSHLKRLENSGLISFKKEGLRVNYSLSGHTNPYASTLLGNLRHWLNDQLEEETISRVRQA